ncbi:MAG TPA: ATP-binding protein [Negativicutes bacterium]|nr:ATP-binding protein [Negativicutes bacterium]
MERVELEARIASLERENRIIRQKLARSETNRALMEEALSSHLEIVKACAQISEDRDAYRELSAKLRTEIEQEYAEKAKVNEKLSKLDRLNLVGETAASICHEVRNPMTTVRGYLQFLEGKHRFAQDKDALLLMIAELDRANSIITDFLSLAKNKRVDLQPGNLKKVLLAIKPMLEINVLRSGHALDYDLQDTPDIIMDEGEIRQLIINLTQNGLEAMVDPGRIFIRTLVHDNAVLLSLTDAGKGIPPEIMEKLGTPFFTTKDNGSGLGLAVSFRIAERHRASINFTSSPAGTTATVSFPIPAALT